MTETSPSSKANSGSEQLTSVPFPIKLHQLLEEMEETGQTKIISWIKGGKSGFKIHDRKKFAEVIMPKYFGSNKLKSFQRSLNLWGFASGKKIDERGIYTHKEFFRGEQELCFAMKRIRVKAPPTASGDAATRSASDPQKQKEKKRKVHPEDEDGTSKSDSDSSVSESSNKKNKKSKSEPAQKKRKQDPAPSKETKEPKSEVSSSVTRTFASSSAAIIHELRRKHERPTATHSSYQPSNQGHGNDAMMSSSSSSAGEVAPRVLGEGLSSQVMASAHTSTTTSPAALMPAATLPATISTANDAVAAATLNALLFGLQQQQQQQEIHSADSAALVQTAALILQQEAARNQQQQLLASVLLREKLAAAAAAAAEKEKQQKQITDLLLLMQMASR